MARVLNVWPRKILDCLNLLDKGKEGLPKLERMVDISDECIFLVPEDFEITFSYATIRKNCDTVIFLGWRDEELIVFGTANLAHLSSDFKSRRYKDFRRLFERIGITPKRFFNLLTQYHPYSDR